nr:GrlR family regulatory protein [Bradyrhizobium prioritasuperba]
MVFQGLYKIEFETPRGKASGVVHALDGRLRGGSSAFAYIGSYSQQGSTVIGDVSSRRHTVDANHPSVYPFDEVRISFSGVVNGDLAMCEGTAAEAPGLAFKALLTKLAD